MFHLKIEKIVELIENEKVIADIGTDHCYLPILGIKNNKGQQWYGSDLRSEPLEIAKKNLIKNNLEAKVKLLQGNGLKPFQTINIDLFIIAGLGGNKIGSFLEQKYKNNQAKFILSPTNNFYTLRKKIQLNNFFIEKEIFFHKKKYILILKINKNQNTNIITDEDLYIGPILKEEINNKDLVTFINERKNHLLKINKIKFNQEIEIYLKFLKKVEHESK